MDPSTSTYVASYETKISNTKCFQVIDNYSALGQKCLSTLVTLLINPHHLDPVSAWNYGLEYISSSIITPYNIKHLVPST